MNLRGTLALTAEVHGPVSPQFQRETNDVLRTMFVEASPEAQAAIVQTEWQVWATPTGGQINSVYPKPRPGEVLLGLFNPATKTLVVFESSILAVSESHGVPVSEAIRDVAAHEMQHRLRLNHTMPLPVPVYAAGPATGPARPALGSCGCGT